MKPADRIFSNRFLRLPGYLLLMIIPVILFITSLDTISSRNKAWYAGGYDPEYAYLFNALNMATFKLAGHIDHPGTTMQVAGGLVLRVSWLLDPRGEDLKTAVLSDPEHYIRQLNIATAVTGCLALLLLGFFLAHSTSLFWVGIIFQLTPFISGFVLFNGFTRVTQEVMQMSAAFAMAAFALHWYFKRYNSDRTNYTLWFAVISGFGLASKIIFIPLLVIPFILLEGWKKRASFIGLSVLFFVLFTLPVIRMYPAMFKWVYNLFLHSGQYGSGSAEVIDKAKYVGELINLIKVNPYLSGIALLTALLLLAMVLYRVFRKKYSDPAAARLLLAVMVAQGAGYLLIAKQPKAAYLLPYECIATINVILIVYLFIRLFPERKTIRTVVVALITMGLVYYGIRSGLDRKRQLYGTDFNWEFEEAWGAATGANQKHAVVFTNPGASPVAGLFFGNAYSHNRYVADLQKIYPDYYILDAYNQRIVHWGGDAITPDALFAEYHGNLLILHTPGWVEPDPSLLNLSDSSGWRMTETYNGRAKLLAPVKVDEKGVFASRKIIFNGAETLDRSQTMINTLSKTKSGDTGILTFEKSHTGLSCVKTTPELPYAFGIEEDSIRPGEKFSVGVWVSGDLKNVVLVGSGLDSKEFYISSNALLAEDQDGWKKISMDFTVDREIKDQKIKIYVWNSGKETVFFDDFRCDRISPLTIDLKANE
ncbi:MAG: hypothetical protein JNL22_07155 [Bacteroidales bacterium]|nr:hypothetical protein [Bacteroidales bacterium]